MLKETGATIVLSLLRIFNLSFSSGIYPKSWKRANVVPIYRKNGNAINDHYKPVSLLSCIGKLFERSVFKYAF